MHFCGIHIEHFSHLSRTKIILACQISFFPTFHYTSALDVLLDTYFNTTPPVKNLFLQRQLCKMEIYRFSVQNKWGRCSTGMSQCCHFAFEQLKTVKIKKYHILYQVFPQTFTELFQFSPLNKPAILKDDYPFQSWGEYNDVHLFHV